MRVPMASTGTTPPPPAASAAARPPRIRTPEGTPWFAWAVFLVLGIPLALMALLTLAARSGVYVDLLRPLWVPWPPDFLKPVVGFAGFAATLGYLAFRLGERSGFRSGTLAGIAQGRNWAEGRYAASGPPPETTDATAPPPPPPPDEPVAAASPADPASGGNGS